MRLSFSCCCGASFHVSGWGIRTITGLDDFADEHAKCIAAWQEGARRRPMPRDPSRVTR